jgi:hypothetical protein
MGGFDEMEDVMITSFCAALGGGTVGEGERD